MPVPYRGSSMMYGQRALHGIPGVSCAYPMCPRVTHNGYGGWSRHAGGPRSRRVSSAAMSPRGWVLLLTAVCAAKSVRAQADPLAVTWPTGERSPTEALISLDHDDDDDNGVPDLADSPLPESDNDLVTVRVVNVPAGGTLSVHTEGGVRVLSPQRVPTDVAAVSASQGVAVVTLVGVAPSHAPRDAAVSFTAGDTTVRVALTVASAVLLHGDNTLVLAHRDAVAPSHEITNNDTLPRLSAWGDTSPDPDNTRVELWDPGADHGSVQVESVGSVTSTRIAPGALRGRLSDLGLVATPGGPFRSRFLRLVGDDVDLRASGVQGQTLLVGLRDILRVHYRREHIAGEVTTDLRVGRPGNDPGPLAARRARLRLMVLRDRPQASGGRPVIGDDDAGAVRIGRNQVAIANEIYVQCLVTWGEPAQAAVSVVDPPPSCLLAVGDDLGLHAEGGVVRFRAGGRAIGPVTVRPGWRPVDTAVAVAETLRRAGFRPRVTQNARTDYGDIGSADVLVRDTAGRLVTLTQEASVPLTTDRRQSVAIGETDFSDGLDEFNNLDSSAGTLEERALIKPLRDDDIGTIDLFVVNRFTRSTRIGEAFVEGDSGAILNALVLDRVGITAEREAWTQSHEIGHILLNQPWHPDNMGPDRPWLLMDADASLAAVSGPKRLTAEECQRMESESGPSAVPSLLTPYDVVQASPRASAYRTWPSTPWYPRPVVPPAETQASTPAVHEAPLPASTYGITFVR